MPLSGPAAEPISDTALAVFVLRGILLSLVTAGIVTSQPRSPAPKISIDQIQGFCPSGVFPSTIWLGRKPDNLGTWGSYCQEGDKTTGEAITAPFAASGQLSLYLAGYPSKRGVSLEIENLADHSKRRITTPEAPGETWQRHDFTVPSGWRGQPVRLIAKDQSTEPGGWLAFSEPVETGSNWGWSEAGFLLLRTFSSFLLLMLPCLAICSVLIQKGVRDAVFVGAVALAGIGGCGYLVFWLWFLWPRLGHAIAFLIPIVGLSVLLGTVRKLNAAGRDALKAMLTLLLLVGAASLLVLSTGFLYGGMEEPFRTAAVRFSHPLPPDNRIPYLFAEGVRVGKVPKPMLGDWRSSDRPPLQTGIALSQYPYNWRPRNLGYAAVSSTVQSLWIFALWLLLIAFEVPPQAAALAIATCFFSGFAFLNTFYVWPKLIAAAYVLAIFAIFFNERLSRALATQKLLSVTAGALVAFGMLAHGGSAFALIGLALTMLALKRTIPFRSFAIILLTGFVLYLPWILYQRFYDPPGDRLLKLHLAGIEPVDKRSFAKALSTAYTNLSSRAILNNKSSNLEIVIGHNREYWSLGLDVLTLWAKQDPKNIAQVECAAERMRVLMFFTPAQCLGFLIIGPFALLIGISKRYRSKTWKTAAIMWLFTALVILPWCLLMFGPATTFIHQGTYATILVAFAGSVLAIWAISRWVAFIAGTLQIALNFLLYVVFMRPSVPFDALPEGVPRYAPLIVALISLGLFGLLLRRLSRQSADGCLACQ